MLELLTGRKPFDRWTQINPPQHTFFSSLAFVLKCHKNNLRQVILVVATPVVSTFSLNFCRSRPRPEQSLGRWATPQLHDIDALDQMVDPALQGLYPSKSLSRFADAIALCVQVKNYLQCIQLSLPPYVSNNSDTAEMLTLLPGTCSPSRSFGRRCRRSCSRWCAWCRGRTWRGCTRASRGATANPAGTTSFKRDGAVNTQIFYENWMYSESFLCRAQRLCKSVSFQDALCRATNSCRSQLSQSWLSSCDELERSTHWTVTVLDLKRCAFSSPLWQCLSAQPKMQPFTVFNQRRPCRADAGFGGFLHSLVSVHCNARFWSPCWIVGNALKSWTTSNAVYLTDFQHLDASCHQLLNLSFESTIAIPG